MLGRLLSHRPVSKLTIRPPVAVAGRAGIALVLIARDEERNAGEWADFHLRAGAAHIYLYDNGSTDRTVDVLRGVAGARLTVMPWDQQLRDALSGRELHNQVIAYGHALCNFGGRHRWMACIDADEFLVPKRADSLDGALAHLADCPSVSLPWHNFGRNGHIEPPKGGTLDNFTRRAADPMGGVRGVTNFKTIVDATRVSALRVHSYEVDGQAVTCNDRGVRFALKDRTRRDFYSAEHLQLNHYYTRSARELEEKLARGAIQTVEAARHAARVRRNVENIEADEVEDLCAPAFLARIGG